MQDLSSLMTRDHPVPLHREPGDLITGPPGEPPDIEFSSAASRGFRAGAGELRVILGLEAVSLCSGDWGQHLWYKPVL